VGLYERALGTGAEGHDEEWLGTARLGLARALAAAGRSDRAREECERAVLLLRRVGAAAEAAALVCFADLTVTADPARAASAAARAARLFGDAGDQHGRGCALLRYGAAQGFLDLTAEGVAAFTAALAIFRDLGERELTADALWFLGVTEHARGAGKEGLPHLMAAIELYRELDRPAGEARAWDALGSAKTALGRKREALDAYRRALDAYRRVGDDPRARWVPYRLESLYADRLRGVAS
jgi:tetratricopeptide (TPR) repeat protein